MDDNVINVDARPIRPLPYDPMVSGVRRAGPGQFCVGLLGVAIVFGLVGAARLWWNISEGELWAYGSFAGFYLLDRSMPYFTAFGLFLIAAGVWRGRA